MWHPGGVVDTTAPEQNDGSNSITFDDDVVNSAVHNAVTLSGQVEKGATVDSIVITNSAGGSGSIGSIGGIDINDTNSGRSITVDSGDINVDGNGKVTVTGQDLSGLADGELTVTMTVTDKAGNTGHVSNNADYLASDGLTVSASLSEFAGGSHPADELIAHVKQENPKLDQVTETTTDTGKPLLIGGTSIVPYRLGDSRGTEDITFISQQADATTAYYGGSGEDTVYLQGNRSDYGDLEQLENQQGADSAVGLYHQAGHDEVAYHVPHAFYNIETIYFADGKYQVDNGELTKVADIVQLDVDVTLNDNDGSEQITSVIISGIPEGGSVPDGEQLDLGDWQVPIDALQPNPGSDAGFSVTLELPEGSAPDLSVTVGAAEVDENGDPVDLREYATAQPGTTVLPSSDPNGDNTVEGGSGDDVLLGDIGGVEVNSTEPTNYNIALIVDTSGSMGESLEPGSSESRLDVLKTSLKSMLENISDHPGTINLALVDFNSSASLSINLDNFTQLSEWEHDRYVDYVIDSLQASGGTNYEAAFNQASSWLNTHSDTNSENLSFFLTDGNPTVSNNSNYWGNTTQSFELRDSIRAYESLAESSSVHAIGVGNGVNADILRFFDNTNVSGSRTWSDYWGSVSAPTGDVEIVNTANDLNTALDEGVREINVLPVGDDGVIGNAGDDILFGDTINTDNLPWDENGLTRPESLPDGSGVDALTTFLEMKNGAAPSDIELYQYIKDNHALFNVEGDTRGGDDTLEGEKVMTSSMVKAVMTPSVVAEVMTLLLVDEVKTP
ncbi:VWA domain-containing protein [Salinivibrio costicola]|uniref:VWA domain-containing protein n=1 Tax=Salinivibrio costicola TaxID=51367 RepID=UPI003F6E9F1D